MEQQLTYENFVEWTRPDMMEEIEVQVGLPRFKMEEKYDMKNVLTSMGMVDAFDMAKSDFSGRTCAWIISDIFIIMKHPPSIVSGSWKKGLHHSFLKCFSFFPFLFRHVTGK